MQLFYIYIVKCVHGTSRLLFRSFIIKKVNFIQTLQAWIAPRFHFHSKNLLPVVFYTSSWNAVFFACVCVCVSPSWFFRLTFIVVCIICLFSVLFRNIWWVFVIAWNHFNCCSLCSLLSSILLLLLNWHKQFHILSFRTLRQHIFLGHCALRQVGHVHPCVPLGLFASRGD